MRKINVITLGCSKNTVDSEHLMARLEAAGYEVVFDSDRTDAKVVVINTCGFIGDAKQESVDMILRAAAAKKAGKIERLFVIGCLSERYADELRAELPEVDDFFGARDWTGIARALGAPEGEELATERHLTTPRHYAYLKISEGCNWRCGYCAIPLIRGPHVSVPMEQLLEEARKLAAGGVKELMVIAQDTTYYGIDLYGERKLAELLRRLCKIDGLVWVRVHYLYPDEMSQELIDVLANEPKIVKYLDIPIQHINDEILRKMNRRGNGEYVRQLFTKLRHEIPGLVLRTSLITGLPGEGEVEFAQLCDFLKEYKLERVGAFAFSPEEGTRAAEMEYPDTEIAKQRAEQVAEIQSRIMDDYNESCVGQVMQVLCEGYDPDEDSYYGRTYADSPDIDGKIWFTAEKHIKTGDFVDIHVVDTYDGELVGVLEEEYNDDCE